MSEALLELRGLLARMRLPEVHLHFPPRDALDENDEFLRRKDLQRSIAEEPYWPKWDGPWWRVALLQELNLSGFTGPTATYIMESMRANYLTFFPARLEEVPKGVDPIRGIPCHCQLGTIYRVLFQTFHDVDMDLPWIRPWFLHYQLPDGGLNCDEAAYAGHTLVNSHSSMVSTLPPLEAVLQCASQRPPVIPVKKGRFDWFRLWKPIPPREREYTREEEAFLDRGAQYLIERRLCRSLSKGGALIDKAWLTPCFPRFYHYDVLRGLSFVVEWAEVRRKPLPAEAVLEVVRVLAGQTDEDGHMIAGRRCWEDATTLRRGRDGTWNKGQPAESFPLLEAVGEVGKTCEWLTKQWADAVKGLMRLDGEGQLGG